MLECCTTVSSGLRLGLGCFHQLKIFDSLFPFESDFVWMLAAFTCSFSRLLDFSGPDVSTDKVEGFE